MVIYLASNNAHKQKEFSSLFCGHSIVLPREAGIAFNPEETGNSFVENCFIKARALFDMLGSVQTPLVLADDSGLCVDILGGRPGIHSARYTGADSLRADGQIERLPEIAALPITQAEKNRLLIEEVNRACATGKFSDTPKTDRACRFVCALVLYAGHDRFFLAQETMEGALIETIESARGEGGFGYDPIVYLKEFGKTVSELSEKEKNNVSHRGKAARAINAVLRAILPTAG